MGMGEWLSWAFLPTSDLADCELEEIFPLKLSKSDFVETDILSTYLKILTDTVERTFGIPAKFEPLLWDNFLQSESNRGLVSLLAEAMSCKTDLFLVYSPSTNVLRKATQQEQDEIKKDYAARGESKKGVFISFKEYRRTEVLRIYSSFEHCVLSSLNKSLNTAKALQVKVSDLRSSVGAQDADVAKGQARSIARALGRGNDVFLDAKDMIETAKVDTEPSEKAISFLAMKKAFILGMPMSYLDGEQTSGIGSTGEADSRAVERGLKQYYVSIVRPVLKALWSIDTTFKSQDFRQVNTSMEVLKTLELVSEELVSIESKRELVARMLELDLKKEEKLIEEGLENAEDELQETVPGAREQADEGGREKVPSQNRRRPRSA